MIREWASGVCPQCQHETGRDLLKQCLNVVEDVIEELAQDEVAELTSMALDRKLESVLDNLQEYLDAPT
jgi:hypothetical protein